METFKGCLQYILAGAILLVVAYLGINKWAENDEAKKEKAQNAKLEKVLSTESGYQKKMVDANIKPKVPFQGGAVILTGIIHNKGDSKRHLVWLSTIRTLGGDKGSPGGIYIKGLSGGAEIHRLSDFHLDLKNSDFFEDFMLIDNPEGSVVEFNDDRVPKTAWGFDFNMRLKPFGWREAMNKKK